MNLGRALAGPIGVLRILTLILGLIVLILTGISHYVDLKEQFFLSVIVITLFASLFLLLVLILDVIPPSMANMLDMSYHYIGGVVLFLASAVMLYSVFYIGDPCSLRYFEIGPACEYQPFIPRVCAGVIGLLNALLFLFLGAMIQRSEYI